MDQHTPSVSSGSNIPLLKWKAEEKESFWGNHKISVIDDTSDVKFSCIKFKPGYASILMNLYRSIKLRMHSYSKIEAGQEGEQVYIRSRLAASIAAVERLGVEPTDQKVSVPVKEKIPITPPPLTSYGRLPTIEEDESDSVNSGESPSVKESTPSSLSDQVGGEDRSVKISRMVSNIKKIHERVKVLLKEEFFGVSRSGPDNASDSSSGLINDVYIGKIGKGWAAEKVEKSVKGGEAEVYLTNSLAIRWKNDQKTEMTTEEFNANVRKEEKILSFLGRHKKGSLVQVFDVGKGKLIDEAIPCSVIVNKRYESDCSKPISSKGEALKKDIQKMAKCMINELSVLMSHGVYPTDLRLANMSYHPGSEELLQLEDLGGSPMDSELNEKPKGIMYSPILGSDCDKALNQCTTKEGRIEVLTKAVLFLAGRALFDLAYVNSTEEKKKKIKASQAQTIPQDVLKGILEVFYDDLQSVFILDLIKSPEKYKILHLQSVFGLF